MSFEACKWVYRTRVDDPLAQSIAWQMAFAADSRTHRVTISVARLAEKTGQVPRSVRRKLRDLERLGAVTVVGDKSGGLRPCTYQFMAPVDPIYLEIADDGSDGVAQEAIGRLAARGASLDDTPDAESSPTPDSQSAPGGTSSPGSADPRSGEGGPDDRGGRTDSPPNLKEGEESKKESPLPPKGGDDGLSSALDASEPEDFGPFWTDYPGHKVMDRERALEAFRLLEREDQRWCRFAAKPYGAELAKLKDRRPIDAHKWIERAGFREFTEAKPRPLPVEHWVTPGSLEFRARAVLAGITGQALPPAVDRGEPGLVRSVLVFDRALPPEALSLAQYATAEGDFPAQWEDFEVGTQNSGAWRQRVKDWTGYDAQQHTIETGEKKQTPGLGDKVYEIALTKKVIRVPQPWPPSKRSVEGGIESDDGGTS
jgi:hypothetical protein